MGLAQLWMTLFNMLMVVSALVELGGSAYIASISWSNFCLILFSVAGFTLFVGIIGLKMNNRSVGCVNCYSVNLFVIILLHAALVFGFLFWEDKTIEVLQDLNSHGNNDQIRDYFDNHRSEFKWAGIGVLSVEFFTFCMSICCVSHVAKNLDDELSAEMNSMHQPLVSTGGSNNFGVVVSQTPQTDARRAQLNEKYGGIFESRQQKSGYDVL